MQALSDNFKSLTLAMDKDGVKHLMPGSYGAFEVTAEAGNSATIEWTLTGQGYSMLCTESPLQQFSRS